MVVQGGLLCKAKGLDKGTEELWNNAGEDGHGKTMGDILEEEFLYSCRFGFGRLMVASF